MPRSEALIKAQKKYEEKKKLLYRQYGFRFYKATDADVIKKLDDVENRNDYIRTLIKNDIKNTKK